MKVELQSGDSIAIPDGCRAIVKDGSVVFEKEQDFKDGDILVSVVNGHRYNAFIYKSTDKRSFHSYYVGLDVCNQISVSDSPSNRWSSSNLSYATEEEKQLLFNKMKEQGLQWNAEEKRVEKIRWRACVGKEYYFFNPSLDVIKIEECRSVICSEHYLARNYFRTNEQAEEAAKRVKEVLHKFHEEIGE